MSIHQFGFIILVFVPAMTFLGYYLGKRKTETPKVVASIVFLTSLVPPVALLLVFILALKRDLPRSQPPLDG